MAVKNATEQEGFRQAYLRDGRAMVCYLLDLVGYCADYTGQVDSMARRLIVEGET